LVEVRGGVDFDRIDDPGEQKRRKDIPYDEEKAREHI
jgi:hypothetical protein